ncbi:hypothetical protein [[Pseudomonas] boreopolis]|uniref:hypothetical protein n=1 Tax=Xanthomonas boreopolis TaxID=86183 RepID=UPI003DA01762
MPSTQASLPVVIHGSGPAPRLKTYKPRAGNPKMAVTLGNRHGVVHLPGVGVVCWPTLVRMAKSAYMLIPQYRKAPGV